MAYRVLIIALFVSSLSLQLNSSVNSPQKLKALTRSTSAVPKEVPDHVLYDFYFRRLALVKEKVDARTSSGHPAADLRSQIAAELAVDGASELTIENIASRSLQEAAHIDIRAQQIIERSRALYPHGHVGKAHPFPQPPPELITLNAARKAIFEQARTDLSRALGQNTIDQVDLRIKRHLTGKLDVTSPAAVKH